MIKLITPGSYDFGEPVMALVPFASRGLVGADKSGFLKRASHLFLDKMADFKPLSGEVPVHIIALGAGDSFGSNRNGDYFSAEVCRRCAHTFEKHARYFRNHLNKNPARSYGLIKHSAFNEGMQRVELIAVLNGTKEAAERNGGLVADIELEKLGRGEDVPTSMGTHVPYDLCSGCGNKARFRTEYCDEKQCEKYGGLKHNIARTFDDGHTLCAHNPSADWFDISTVGRNADRISFNLGALQGYDDMLKSAAAMPRLSGAAWADRCGVTTPAWLLTQNNPWMPPTMVRQLKAAGALIEAEDRLQQKKLASNPLAFSDGARHPVTMPDVRRGREKFGAVMTALHEQQCLLPLTAFLELMTGDSREKIATLLPSVSAALPGAVNRLVADQDFERLLQQNAYTSDLAPSQQTRGWVCKYAADWSLAPTRIVERGQLAIIRGLKPTMQKTASYTRSADALAREYALYEIAFLSAQPENAMLQQLVDHVVQHNYAQ